MESSSILSYFFFVHCYKLNRSQVRLYYNSKSQKRGKARDS